MRHMNQDRIFLLHIGPPFLQRGHLRHLFHEQNARKRPIVRWVRSISYIPSIKLWHLTIGRLPYGHRACPSRTLHRFFILLSISHFFKFVFTFYVTGLQFPYHVSFRRIFRYSSYENTLFRDAFVVSFNIPV